MRPARRGPRRSRAGARARGRPRSGGRPSPGGARRSSAFSLLRVLSSLRGDAVEIRRRDIVRDDRVVDAGSAPSAMPNGSRSSGSLPLARVLVAARRGAALGPQALLVGAGFAVRGRPLAGLALSDGLPSPGVRAWLADRWSCRSLPAADSVGAPSERVRSRPDVSAWS